MSIKHQMCLVGLAAGVGMPAAALQDDRQRGASTARWTAPGWYLLEHRGNSRGELLRAGPYPAEAACWEARRLMEPPAPTGHPELDVLSCRALKQAPAE